MNVDLANGPLEKTKMNRVVTVWIPIQLILMLLFSLGWQNGAVAQTETSSLAERDMSLRFSLLSGIPDVVGISASVSAFHPFDVELGASLGFSASGVGPTAYLRTGVAFPIVNTRDPVWWDGWTLDLFTHAGYRISDAGPICFLGCDGTETHTLDHALTTTGGLDLTHWGSPDLGFTIQLTCGAAAFWVSDGIEWIPELRLAVGFAY